MLKWLRLQNFKSFVDEAVQLAPVTLLVGANASGKSNFLDAIRFLQGVGLGLPIAEILRGRWEAGREVWPGVRGGLAEVARAGTNAFTIESGWHIGGVDLHHTITCALEPEPAIEREGLYLAEKPTYLFETHAPTLGSNVGRSPGGALRVAFRGTRGGRNPSTEYPSSRSLLAQIQPASRIDPEVLSAVEAMRGALTSSLFLDIMPSKMRDYVPRTVTSLGANGENVSAVLHRLCQDEEQKANLVDWLSELCAPALGDLAFTETELKDVMLVLVEKDGTRISARSASDGTLRFLGELTALLTAPAGSLLLLEEIENGLHPARVHLLVEILESVTRDADRQIIATTHSPLVLHALSKEALGGAIVFGRSPDAAGMRIKRLQDLPSFGDLAPRCGVKHMFATKWLERAL